eukprot:2684132-Amphidinium_carterae.1
MVWVRLRHVGSLLGRQYWMACMGKAQGLEAVNTSEIDIIVKQPGPFQLPWFRIAVPEAKPT